MLTRRSCYLGVILALVATQGAPALAQLITGGESLIGKHNPFRTVDPSQSIDVIEVSKRLDCLNEKLRDDGLVVLKQPDVFSQARMTHFRTDFENQMVGDLKTFHLVLAARINRLDQATFTQSTNLSASLSAPGTTNLHASSTGVGAAAPAVPSAPTVPSNGSVAPGFSTTLDPTKNAFSSLGLDANVPSATAPLGIGVDPTVYLDEKKRFLEHLNQIRRINHGPDQNDSSGYGLYLVRLPVSITPGECTYQGYGAELALTAEHEFPPGFLKSSFRNLVINDLVDQLGPVVYEVIRSGLLDKLRNSQDQKIALPVMKARKRQLLEDGFKKYLRDRRYLAPGTDLDAQFLNPLAKYLTESPRTPDTDPQTGEKMTVFQKRFGDIKNMSCEIMKSDKAFNEEDLKAQDATLTNLFENLSKLKEGEPAKTSDFEATRLTINNILTKLADLDRDKSNSCGPVDDGVLNLFDKFYTALTFRASDGEQSVLTDLFRVSNEIPKLTAAINAGEASKNVLKISLPSTRNPKKRYPIAPQEILDFFLVDNIRLLAQDAKDSAITKNPHLTDIRSHLRHSLEVAYSAMANAAEGKKSVLDEKDLMNEIFEAVNNREFGTDGKLEGLYQKLAGQVLEKGRKNIYKKPNTTHLPLASLCWAIAIDAGLLDHSLQGWIPKVFEANDVAMAIPDDSHFYFQDQAQLAVIEPVFNEFVKRQWPIVTFALDPVTDQQNVADSFTLQRDLQLALSYAFATGQINFGQLNTFRRQIQQSSDTIALNRTVTGFIHGNDTFGFRFTPRFQNPPMQRTNLGVITSQLISGGPGPDYQIKKSKLEPGIREIHAVLLIPTFLPTLRMEVSSNWFKLNDPEHLVFHTKRMLERGREVQELRQAVIHACNTRDYRPADLKVLKAKLAQLEAILPAQSKVVQLPFENTASGFDLYAEGATALVPELSGYDGIDTVKPTKDGSATTPADIFLYGKFFDLLDTRVIIGGAYIPPLPPNVNPTAPPQFQPTGGFEIISREVVHVLIPAAAQPTVTIDGGTYLEVYVATPTGISNRLLVPYTAPAPAPQMAFDLKAEPQSTELDIFYKWDKDPAGANILVATDDFGLNKPLHITWDSPVGFAPKTLQATFNATVNGQIINFSLPANSGTQDDYGVDRQVMTVYLLNLLKNTVAPQTPLPDPISMAVSVQPYVPLDGMGYRVLSAGKPLKTPLTVRLVQKIGEPKLQNVAMPPLPQPPAQKPAASLQRPGTPGDNVINQARVREVDASLVKTSQFPIPLPPQFPSLDGTPSLPASPGNLAALAGGLPPLPSPLTVPTPASLLKNVPSLGNLSPASTVQVPTIVVTPSPLTVVAPPNVPATRSHSRLFRMFDHKKGATPAQPPR